MILLLGADKHLREDTPECRIDNYFEAQKRKLEFIRNIKHDLALEAGDIFDYWKSSPFLEGFAIRNLVKHIVAIPGQHDLPQHNLNLKDKSSFGVLEAAGTFDTTNYKDIGSGIYNSIEDFVIYKVPWGQRIPRRAEEKYKNSFRILMCHTLIYQGKEPFPGAAISGSTAKEFLRKHEFDLIVTGDHHRTIIEEYNGRHLINSGSMMRMTAAQADHKPCVFTFNTETKEIVQIFLPIKEGVVSREHIESANNRTARVDAFLNSLKNDDIELKLSFSDNMKKYLAQNSISQSVKDIIYKVMEK